MIQKLVRDNAEKLLSQDGVNNPAQFDECPSSLVMPLLYAKMVEEVAGIGMSHTPEDSVSKLIDLLEVVYAVASKYKVSSQQLNAMRHSRLIQLGGYKKMVLMTKSNPDVKNDGTIHSSTDSEQSVSDTPSG